MGTAAYATHLWLRCEAGVTAAHQRGARSHGRSGVLVAGLLLGPSGQHVSLPEEPRGFCSAELRPVSPFGVLELWRRSATAAGSFSPCVGRPGQSRAGTCYYLSASEPGGWCLGRVVRESPLLLSLAKDLALHPSFGSSL